MERKKVNTLDVYANGPEKTAVMVVNKTHAYVVTLPDKVNHSVTPLPTSLDCNTFIADGLPSAPVDYSRPFEIAWYIVGRTSRDGWMISLSPF
jgi:hypothetical protein